MPERRKSSRLDICIPVSLRLLGTAVLPHPINVETSNISADGLSIAIKMKVKDGHLSVPGTEKPTRLIPYLLLNDKVLELGIKILPKGRRIKGIGTVKWYHRGLSGDSYQLRAGIFIDEMQSDQKDKWLEFVRTIASMQEVDMPS